MFPRHRPLRFPDDEAVCVSRRLLPYPGRPEDADRSLTVKELQGRLIAREDWYAILSAEGTGKTSLIHQLQHQLNSSPLHPLVALDRFDLEVYRAEETSIEDVLRGLLDHIVRKLHGQGYEVREPAIDGRMVNAFVPSLIQVIEPLECGGRPARLLVFLDDMQHLRPELAEALAGQLKRLHNDHHHRVTCFLAGDDDLETVKDDWSPLRGLFEVYTLADFGLKDLGVFEATIERAGLNLEREAWEALLRQTGGYPYLMWDLLGALAEVPRLSITADTIVRVAQDVVMNRPPVPLETALRALERLARLPRAETAACAVTLDLLHGKPVKYKTAGTENLVLKGIAKIKPDGQLQWRNAMVQTFMQDHTDKLREWARWEPASGYVLNARGTIHVSLVMNLRRFVKKEHKDRFDAIRASSEYAKALAGLEQKVHDSDSLFYVDGHEDTLRDIGIDLNIFRHQSAESAFVPIYYLKDPKDHPHISSTLSERVTESEDIEKYLEEIQEEWQQWDRMSVQLTPYGTVHVRLEQNLPDKGEPLVGVLKRVLGLERQLTSEQREAEKREIYRQVEEGRLDEAEERIRRLRRAEALQGFRRQMERSIQWEIAMGLVELFIQECFEQATDAQSEVYRWPGEQALVVDFKKGGERNKEVDPLYPLRERYVIYVFDRVCDCGEQRQKVLDFADFFNPKQDYWAREIGALLEGVAIERGESARFPDFKEKMACQLIEEDLSSWQGELYLATTDNALIYYKSEDKRVSLSSSDGAHLKRCERGRCILAPTLQRIYFPHRSSEYRDYWLCIIRGMEYIINLRLMAHLVARETTRNLGEIAELEGRAGDPAIAPDVRRLHKRVTTMTRLISRLRDVSTPMFIATADYATRKFDHLINISGIPTVLAHAESNIREINTFLQHHENMLAQRQSDRLSVVFSVVGLVLYLLALPSFILDWEQSSWAKWVKLHWGSVAMRGIQVGGALLPILVLVALIIWLVFGRLRRR